MSYQVWDFPSYRSKHWLWIVYVFLLAITLLPSFIFDIYRRIAYGNELLSIFVEIFVYFIIFVAPVIWFYIKLKSEKSNEITLDEKSIIKTTKEGKDTIHLSNITSLELYAREGYKPNTVDLDRDLEERLVGDGGGEDPLGVLLIKSNDNRQMTIRLNYLKKSDLHILLTNLLSHTQELDNSSKDYKYLEKIVSLKVNSTDQEVENIALEAAKERNLKPSDKFISDQKYNNKMLLLIAFIIIGLTVFVQLWTGENFNRPYGY